MDIEHRGLLGHRDADQKRRGCHDGDEDRHCCPIPATAGRLDPALFASGQADQAVDDRKHEKRRAKPHRPGFRQPLPVFEMKQPLVSKTPAAPGPGQEILGERADHEHVQQRRQAEPDKAVAQEPREPLPVIGRGGEIAGNEEQRGHEKRLQKALVDPEEKRGAETRLLPIDVIPVSERTVGVTRVHAEHQNDHRPPDVIDEQQTGCASRFGHRA